MNRKSDAATFQYFPKMKKSICALCIFLGITVQIKKQWLFEDRGNIVLTDGS